MNRGYRRVPGYKRFDEHEKPFKQANLVILTSVNGRDGWHPLKADEVPDWVKTPENIARMRAGFDCMDPTQPGDGSNWYRAVPMPTVH